MRLITIAAALIITSTLLGYAEEGNARLLAEAELMVFPADSSPVIAVLSGGTVVTVITEETDQTFWTRIRFSDAAGTAVEGYTASVLLESDDTPHLQAYRVGMFLLEKGNPNGAAEYFLYFYDTELPHLRNAVLSGESMDFEALRRIISAGAALSRFSSSYVEKYHEVVEIAEIETAVPMMYEADPIFTRKLIEYLYRAGTVDDMQTAVQVINVLKDSGIPDAEDQEYFTGYEKILLKALAGAGA